MTTTDWISGQTLYAADLDMAFGRCIDRAGDIMSGDLTLAADPVTDLVAATKRYVDLKAGAGIGEAAEDGKTYGRINASWSEVLPIGGGALSGGLHFGSVNAPGGITDLSRHIDLYGGTFGFSVTSARLNVVAPTGSSQFFTVGVLDTLQLTETFIRPKVGFSWSGTLASSPTDLSKHIDFDGGNWGFSLSSGQVNVVANNTLIMSWTATLVNAAKPIVLPADPTTALQAATKQYVDNSIALSGGTGPGAGNSGRNGILNPQFDQMQRGAGPFVAQGYGFDRWKNLASGGDTISVTQVALSDADRAAIGHDGARFAYQCTFVGTAGGGAQSAVVQGVEGIQRYSGRPVVHSVWARCTSGTMNMPMSVAQNFGTGGAGQFTVSVPTQVVTTSWQRFIVKFTMPSIATRALGTQGTDYNQIAYYFSQASGTVQSNTIQLWFPQLELGTEASAPDIRDPSLEIFLIRRYTRKINGITFGGYNVAGQNVYQAITLDPPMRVTPGAALSNQSYTNASGVNGTNITPNNITMNAPVTATGTGIITTDLLLTAELG